MQVRMNTLPVYYMERSNLMEQKEKKNETVCFCLEIKKETEEET